MDTYNLKDDKKVFGIRVTTFPIGIGEAFEALAQKISEGYDRAYYGLSQISNDQIIYIAAAEEKYEGEAKKYNYEAYTIEKGNYLIVIVRDWRKKINHIKDVFDEIMQDSNYDTTRPCIEWYKDDEEMWCMVKSK